MQGPESSRGLLDLVHAMSLAEDLEGVLAALIGAASELIRCDGCAVMWAAEDYLKVLGSRGATAALPGLVLPISQMGAARPVVEGKRCVLIADTTSDGRWQRVPGEERARSWLGIPLVYADRAVGLLEWTARESRRFSEADVVVGGEGAQYSAPLLHAAMLAREMRRRLSESADQVDRPGLPGTGRGVDVAAELSNLVAEARESTGARHAFAYVLDQESGLMRCAAASGDRDRLMGMRLLGDGSVGGWSLPPDRANARHGRHPSDREVLSALRCNAVQVLPLRVRGEIVGMLGVADQLSARSFPADAARVMTHLASQASLLLDRSFQAMPEPERYDFGAIVQSSPLSIGALSPAGDILYCNSGMADLLGRSSQSLIGKNLTELLVMSDRRRLSHVLEEVVVTQQRLQVDVRLRAAAGEQRHLRIWLALVPPVVGRSQSIVAIADDVTALKILEQERVEHLRELGDKNAQLRELDQLKSRFVANVSHELRTPLAVIKLFATLARKGRPEKQEHYLQTIEQETHRLETIVENILDLTRMDRQVLQVHPEWLDVEQVAAQVVEVYAEAARRRDIDLVDEIGGPLVPIWADKNHLVQMLTNLVDNAIRYTPRGGRVWLQAQTYARDGQTIVEIQVSDTGPGIPEDEKEKVFERFYRGRNNLGSTGTGLGLAIVRELMAQHHGTVSLRSHAGEGSTFALQFPVPKPPSAAASPEGYEPCPPEPGPDPARQDLSDR